MKSQTVDSAYEDDESHPIPFVGNLDAELRTSSGVHVGIVIASPLGNDVRSISRLVRKFENYIDYLKREREIWNRTNATQMVSRFYVDIHPGSCAEAFEVVSKYGSKIQDESMSFRLSTKNDGFGIH